MRITGGHAGGRILKVPKGLAVRPTPDLVKQAVFNSLGTRVEGAKVLELFAGSGALSLEALSRGAVSALCVELSARHAEILKQNARAAGFDALHVRVQDVFPVIGQLAGNGEKFDLILADPPYGEKNVNRRSTSLAQKVLDDPRLPGLLSSGGLLVLGHSKRDTLSFPESWKERKTLKHGDSLMRFLEVATPPADVRSAAPSPADDPRCSARHGRDLPGANFGDMAVDHLGDWRDLAGDLQVIEGVLQMAALFLEIGQVHGNLFQAEEIRLFLSGFALIPAAQRQLP
jgi:16S rRNA (guanine(966)-N(2))-methyltransferase RsmD